MQVLSEILIAVDRGDFAALTLLDLSASFNTVDLEILLQRLQSDKLCYRWLSPALVSVVSYIYRYPCLGRSGYVRRGATSSTVIYLQVCSVPHGSVLGPILVIL